jgi:MoxR-like ATPase
MTQAPSPRRSGRAVDHKRAAAALEAVVFEIKRVIVGQDRIIENVLTSLLARGHCLLEGVPGLAKTLLVETLATAVGGSFSRIQFTPDLVPSDIVGTRIYRPSQERFDVELGPVFANFVLADEINRAPAKIQAALLEVMSERHVTLAGETHPVPLPFVVLATQNPLESEGVYPLPEAQQDRFLLKPIVGHPSYREELEIVRRMGVDPPRPKPVIGIEQLALLQGAADEVFVDHDVADYAVRLVMATREPDQHGAPELVTLLAHGASPRASLGLSAAARARALLHGRAYAVVADVAAVAHDVLRHRLVLSYEALADGVEPEAIVDRILETVPVPDQRGHARQSVSEPPRPPAPPSASPPSRPTRRGRPRP